MAVYLPGKFARFNLYNSLLGFNNAVTGPFRWQPGFRRERLDTSSFESAVSADGYNVHTEGMTGPLDTTFTVEGWLRDDLLNLFWPAPPLLCDMLFRKNVALGYRNVYADVLDFNPGTAFREVGKFTASLQASGLVAMAA